MKLLQNIEIMTKKNKIPFATMLGIVQRGTVATLCMISSLLFVASDCKKHDSTNLQGTKWKLEGIVNEKTGVMQVLEPVNCEECYSFTFDTDATFTGFSSTNELFGEYKADSKTHAIRLIRIGGTKIAEHPDGELYFEILKTIQSFSLKENELILSYGDGNYYLTFKKL